MRTRIYLGVAAMVVVAGCSGGGETGNAALGIVQFQVTLSATELHVVGLDAQGTQVAALALVKGHVSIPSEGMEGEGQTLSVNLRGQEMEHSGLGTGAVKLPSTGDHNMDLFLTDPHVAPLLAERGISLAPATTVPSASG